MCEDYTSYLLGVSNDLKKPYLTDVIAYHFPNETHVYVIMSIYNVPVDRRAEEIHQNYSLIFDGVTYNTLLPVNSSYPYHSIMKYILPFPFNIRNGICSNHCKQCSTSCVFECACMSPKSYCKAKYDTMCVCLRLQLHG